jgi:hypothetical protein
MSSDANQTTVPTASNGGLGGRVGVSISAAATTPPF